MAALIWTPHRVAAGGEHEQEIKARVTQIKNLVEQTEQGYEKEKLNERIARLSGGVAVIQARPSTCYPALCHALPFAAWLLRAARTVC